MEQKTKKPISKNLIKRLHTIYSAQGIDDEQKWAILLDLTDGRTNTTKELTYSEAMYLCGYLNGAKKENRDLTITEREIRRRRSAVLKRVQRIGIDTTAVSYTHLHEHQIFFNPERHFTGFFSTFPCSAVSIYLLCPFLCYNSL